jgi:hypothetical protein
MTNNLPITCATTNLDGEQIIIKNGETGYYKVPAGLVDSDTYNEKHGATEEAIRVMFSASMFGWDIPAVTNYEVQS